MAPPRATTTTTTAARNSNSSSSTANTSTGSCAATLRTAVIVVVGLIAVHVLFVADEPVLPAHVRLPVRRVLLQLQRDAAHHFGAVAHLLHRTLSSFTAAASSAESTSRRHGNAALSPFGAFDAIPRPVDDAALKQLHSVGGSKHVFIMFYATWCGHCTKLKPKFLEFANLVSNDPEAVALGITAATHDSTNGSQITGLEVNAYPTLALVSFDQNGEPTYKNYELSRSPDAILKWAKKRVKSQSGEKEKLTQFSTFDQIANPEDTEELKQLFNEGHRFVFVMYYATWCQHCTRYKPTFVKLANLMLNDPEAVALGITAVTHDSSQGSKIKGLPISAYPTLALVVFDKKGEPLFQKYELSRKPEDILKWIKQKSVAPKSIDSALGIKHEFKSIPAGVLVYVPEGESLLHASIRTGVDSSKIIVSRSAEAVAEVTTGKIDFDTSKLTNFIFVKREYALTVGYDRVESVSSLLFLEEQEGIVSFETFINNIDVTPTNILLFRASDPKKAALKYDYLRNVLKRNTVTDGKVIIVYLSDTDKDNNLVHSFNMIVGCKDSFILFDRESNRKNGISVTNVTTWLSKQEFADYWAERIINKSITTNDANSLQSAKDCGSPAIVDALTGTLAEFLELNEKSFVFVGTNSKHASDLKKFRDFCKKEENKVPCAIYDSSHSGNNKEISIYDHKHKLNDKSSTVIFSQSKKFHSEVKVEKLEKFTKNIEDL